MAITAGVQYYENKDHQDVNYPATDVLQVMGCACHPWKPLPHVLDMDMLLQAYNGKPYYNLCNCNISHQLLSIIN
jgi:hypothetical protein